MEEEVTVGSGEWALPGTLTKPLDAEDAPLVILVQGSGPQDRDETVGPNKPFQEIAWGLAQQGIAVLRYDKRTYVYPEECAAALDTLTIYEETIDDAATALALGKSLGFDEIYILGHSLGGMMIPRIATATPDAAGYIMLAAAARPLEDLFLAQTEYILSVDGEMSTSDEAALAATKEQWNNVRNLTAASDLSPEELFNMPVSYLLDLKEYQPAEAAQAITKLLLILQGEADYQVTMEDFQLFKEALDGKDNVTFQSYPGLQHLFMPAAAEMATPADYESAGCVDEQVLLDIASWINGNG